MAWFAGKKALFHLGFEGVLSLVCGGCCSVSFPDRLELFSAEKGAGKNQDPAGKREGIQESVL